MTSIGAGVIQAAAAGVHAEHPQLARLFIVCAIAQVGVGLLALARPNRIVAALLVTVSAAAVVGWLATRVTGISWIDGLEVREAPQFADTVCALLAATAVGCALGATMIGKRRAATPHLSFPAFLVAALTIPAMLSGGTHVHSHALGAALQAAPPRRSSTNRSRTPMPPTARLSPSSTSRQRTATPPIRPVRRAQPAQADSSHGVGNVDLAAPVGPHQADRRLRRCRRDARAASASHQAGRGLVEGSAEVRRSGGRGRRRIRVHR